MIEEKQIIVHNSMISYLVKKSLSRKSVSCVFLHGWRSQKEVWNKVIQLLNQKTDYSVYALDLPGFGKSPSSTQINTLSDYCSVVQEFIKKLNLKKVCLLGHSFGGRISIKIASFSTHSIQKVVLVDSAGFANRSTNIRLQNKVAHLVNPVFKINLLKPLRKRIYHFLQASDYVEREDLKKVFQNILEEDLTFYLKKIKQLTLLVWGEKDLETPISFAKKMHSLIAKSTLKIIPGAGHFPFIDNPTLFTKYLIDFVSK